MGDQVEFNPRGMTAGLFAGVAIALGVPAITLGMGHNLSPGMQLTVIIVAVGAGGITALTAAFFGLVIPRSVNTGGKTCEKTKEEYLIPPGN